MRRRRLPGRANWRSDRLLFSTARMRRSSPLPPGELNRLGRHCNRAARAFLRADSAALAVVVFELEAPPRPQLRHGVVRAHAITVVAFEAGTAGEASPGFVERVALIETLHDLLEGRGPARHFKHGPHRLWSFAIVPGVELVGGCDVGRAAADYKPRREATHRCSTRPSCRARPRR